MAPTSRFGRLFILALVLACAGCVKQDGRRILGHWRAERFEMGSLMLPIGPELNISDKLLVVSENMHMPIEALTQDGDKVILDLPMHIGLKFKFVDQDRMYLDLPLIDRIYYKRVVDAQPVQVQQAQPASREIAVSPAVRRPDAVTTAPEIEHIQKAQPQAAAGVGAYNDAVAAVRRGDMDVAVRSLHEAFLQGFRDVERCRSNADFEPLRSDARYQALLARYDVHA